MACQEALGRIVGSEESRKNNRRVMPDFLTSKVWPAGYSDRGIEEGVFGRMEEGKSAISIGAVGAFITSDNVEQMMVDVACEREGENGL